MKLTIDITMCKPRSPDWVARQIESAIRQASSFSFSVASVEVQPVPEPETGEQDAPDLSKLV